MRHAVPLLALILILGLAVPSPASPRGGPGRLVKIAFDPPGADNGSNASLDKETVTIANRARHRITLTGWTLRDRDQHVFRFPSFRLGAGAKVTIHTGSGSNNAHNLYWGSDGYVWNNDGDTATLRRPSGVLADRCTYSGSGSSVTC